MSYAPEDDQSAYESECEHEDDQQTKTTPTNSSNVKQNLGVTILASRFAANTRRGVQKMKDMDMPTFQKPEEPDFSAEPDDD